MSPLIRQGDLVMTVPVKEPRFGDVVVVTSDPVIVHRVVRFTNKVCGNKGGC